MVFSIDPTLEKDSVLLGELELSEVRLIPDSDNPWVVLVPMRNGITEIFNLTEEDQGKLIKEIATVSEVMSNVFQADKINIGALGNIVSQLHVHIICRYKGDRAWPEAIWGTKKGDDEFKIDQNIDLLSSALWG